MCVREVIRIPPFLASSLSSNTSTHSQKIALLSRPIKVSPTERQTSKVLIDGMQQRARARDAERRVLIRRFTRIVGAIALFDHHSLAGRAERFDREVFAFFHLRLDVGLDNGHALAAVDHVGADAVPVKVLNALDCKRERRTTEHDRNEKKPDDGISVLEKAEYSPLCVLPFASNS